MNMGVNLSNVNLDNVQANQVLEAIPPGWYDAVITGSEMKPTRDGSGQYLQFEIQVTGGQYAGRKLFDRLNLVNNNPTAVEIAYKTLKSIYNAVGKARVDSSNELHGIPLKVKAKVRAAEGQYSATNEVQGYDHATSAHETAGGAAPAVGAPGGAPPWAAAQHPQPQTPAAQPQQPAPAPAPAWQPPAAQQPWAQPQAPQAAAPAAAPAAAAPAAGGPVPPWAR